MAADAAAEDDAPLWTPRLRRRVLLGLIALLCILLLVVVPPYFSVMRYQRRVATAISGALGRPVHFDSITLNLLPVPGLTIHNFVVSESPEFGYEPVLRANTVEARLRFASLWRRRLEVSRISLDGPSVNLVRRPGDGRWNLQGILMQASQLQSAPTAQQKAGEAPRFPYIEATDARINIKNGDSKLPFSVKEAEFALWLPEPDQWRLRMVGKPVRTDTDVNDVGLLRVEATLGRAVDLEAAPIDLQAGWKPTPLGEAGKATVGYDLGWRGEVSATASLHGTLGAARLQTDVHLRSLHRADLLPEQTMEVNAHCEAATAGLLRSLHDVRCAVPTDNSLSFAGVVDALRKLPSASEALDGTADRAKQGVVLLSAEVPNVLDWQTVSGSVALNNAAAEYALAWARLFTRSVPPTVQVGGTFDLTAGLQQAGGGNGRWDAALTCTCTLPRPSHADAAHLPTAETDQRPNIWLVTASKVVPRDAALPPAFAVAASPAPTQQSGARQVDATPTSLSPHESVQGLVTRDGYSLHYDTAADVEQAATVLPRLGEGLPAQAPRELDVRADWHGSQSWTTVPPPRSLPKASRRRRHRS